MQTKTLEGTLRASLRQALDREVGPHPAWAGSPAAQRVAKLDGHARRAPLRLLAVAAVIGTAIGAALLVGAVRQPARAANGWVAYTVYERAGAADPDTDIWFAGRGRAAYRVVGDDDDGVDQACPAFSPDGRHLAYGSIEGLWSQAGAVSPRWPDYRNAAVVIAEVSDEGVLDEGRRFLVGDGVGLPCPVWSPSGEALAFGVPRTSPINPTQSGEGSDVWILRPASGDIAIVPDLLAHDLEWSPDGDTLAIVGGTEVADVELLDPPIHLYDLASGDLRTLDGTAGAEGVTWSPDGRRLAFGSRDGIRLLEVQTGAQQLLTTAYGSVHGIGPVWSPDGTTIAYQRMTYGGTERHEVVLVALDDPAPSGGPAHQVVLPVDRTLTDGSRASLYPWRVSWSPDGTYLLYVAWTFPDPATEETWAVAVPTDPNAPAVVLATNALAYDSGDAMRVQFQTWQSRAAVP